MPYLTASTMESKNAVDAREECVFSERGIEMGREGNGLGMYEVDIGRQDNVTFIF